MIFREMCFGRCCCFSFSLALSHSRIYIFCRIYFYSSHISHIRRDTTETSISVFFRPDSLLPLLLLQVSRLLLMSAFFYLPLTRICFLHHTAAFTYYESFRNALKFVENLALRTCAEDGTVFKEKHIQIFQFF